MTEHASPASDDVREMDDIELITMWLNGKLTPARAEEVRTRLEQDTTFRDLAGPLILLWGDPSHRRRKPRPEGEKERVWEDFVKRTGFPNRSPGAVREEPVTVGYEVVRKPRWRRWWEIGFLLLVIYMVVSTEFREPISAWWRGESDSVPVPYDTGWIAIGDRIHVQLTPGAELRIAREPLNNMTHVLLDGAARFRVRAFRENAPGPRGSALVVGTRAGEVTAGEAEFSVFARADTTGVQVHQTARRLRIGFTDKTVDATVVVDTTGTMPFGKRHVTYHVPLSERDSTRIVRGRAPDRDTPHP